MIKALTLIVALSLSMGAQGQVYKCKNAAGKLEFRDVPCMDGEKMRGISPNVNTVTMSPYANHDDSRADSAGPSAVSQMQETARTGCDMTADRPVLEKLHDHYKEMQELMRVAETTARINLGNARLKLSETRQKISGVQVESQCAQHIKQAAQRYAEKSERAITEFARKNESNLKQLFKEAAEADYQYNLTRNMFL